MGPPQDEHFPLDVDWEELKPPPCNQEIADASARLAAVEGYLFQRCRQTCALGERTLPAWIIRWSIAPVHLKKQLSIASIVQAIVV